MKGSIVASRVPGHLEARRPSRSAPGGRPITAGSYGALGALALTLAITAFPGLAQAQPSHHGVADRGGDPSQVTQCQDPDTACAPSISSAPWTVFALGADGSFTVTASGDPTPTLDESGPLPSGVLFTDNGDATATLTGAAAAGTLGTYPITITAANGVGAGVTQAFLLVVGSPPVITSAASTTFTQGVAGSFTFQTGGFPAAHYSEVGSLPLGVALSATGTLAGTPAPGAQGTFPITVTACNGVQPSATEAFILTVNVPPSIGNMPEPVFVTGQASSFTITGTGVPPPTLAEVGTLPVGVTFTDNGDGTATLSGTPDPDTSGTYPIAVTADNGVAPSATEDAVIAVYAPLDFTSPDTATFTPGSPGSFSFQAGGPPTPTFTVRGPRPTGVSLAPDGVLSGTPAPGTGGTYVLEVEASNGVAPDVTQSFILGVTGPPVITSNSLTIFTPGQLGSFNIEARGYPEPSFSETGLLPPGLSFTSHGTLFGSPTAGTDGAYPIVVTATNGQPPDAVQAFTVYVGFSIFNTSLPGTQGPALFGPIDHNRRDGRSVDLRVRQPAQRTSPGPEHGSHRRHAPGRGDFQVRRHGHL